MSQPNTQGSSPAPATGPEAGPGTDLETSLEVNNLSLHYGDKQALIDINLGIATKKVTAFIGPSGCGKSTLLRLIAGLETLSSGEIVIADRAIMDLPPSKRGIAMVFQSYALYPHMTVFHNMVFSLELQGVPKKEIAERVESAAKILQMEHLLSRRPAALSGGQRQRVAIGRAIVRNPDVFLFDEPLSNLDAALRHETRVEIAKLHTQLAATTIYVTHDQVEAMTMADRIVIMKDGHIQQIGTPSEVYHTPANTFVAGFIGSPAMNMLPAEASGGVIKINGGTVVPLQRPAVSNGKLMLGIRPEDLEPIDGPALISGTVNVQEPLGHETLIHVSAAFGDVIAKADGRTPPPVGKTVNLSAAPENIHVFDVASGAAIR